MSNQRDDGKPLRLLIVDESEAPCDGLPTTVDLRLAVVDAGSVTRVAEQFRPDVVLLNANLPRHCACAAELACLGLPTAPDLLFVDEVVRPRNVCSALALGAHGYWTGRELLAHLPAVLEQLAAEQVSFCTEARRYLKSTPQGVLFAPSADCHAISKLTSRQAEVLALLASGLTVKECAEQLGLSPNTVDNHKSQIMERLGTHRVADLIRIAFQEGLI